MRWLRRPLLIFVISRLVVVLAAYLGVALLGHTMTADAYHLRGTGNVLLDVFGSRWDTGFYVSIVEEGYRLEEVLLPSVAFFPLLPLLMRLFLPLTGDAVVAGILIANIALLLASLLFYRLVSMEWGEPMAGRALWYLLIFPTSFFGSAIYSESLFLLAAVGALYSARRDRWGVAALFAIGAGLARLMGVIVAPMLALEWLRQARARRSGEQQGVLSEMPRQARSTMTTLGATLGPLAAVLAAPAGLLTYMAYLWRTFGDPLAFARGAAVWEREPRLPGETVTALLQTIRGGTLPINDLIDLSMVLLFLLAAFVLLYRRQWVEGIFVWLGVMLPVSSGLLMSQRRYVWVLFPVYVLLAKWGRRAWVDRLITAIFLCLLTIFVLLFANGYWVG